MSESIEHIVFYRELPEPERERLRAELASDPELATAFVRWQAVHADVRRSLDDEVGEREGLVLHALSRLGRDADLTDDDRWVVANSEERLDRALSHHRGLEAVVSDIQDAAEEFDLLWGRWMEVVEDDRGQDRPKRRDRGARRGRRVLVRTALAASVVLFAVILALLARRDLETVTLSTSDDEMQIVELGDGSTVRLMGGSKLSYVPPEKASALDRRAELTGRAYFEITHADAGFVVKTPTAHITVLGTSFGVRADEAGAEVVLAGGRLSLSPRDVPSRTVTLQPGQMSRVARSALPTAPVDVDVSEQLAWTDLFIFTSTPLEDIVRQLTDHYRVTITYPQHLRQERVTGSFDRDLPLHEILSTVASALGATVRPAEGGGYDIVPM
ncbi:MAG: FecR domain-containing protein [Rhodothermales bacterium]